MSKTKTRLTSLILAIFMVLGFFSTFPILRTNAETFGDFTYTVLEDGTAEITDYTGLETELEIPAEIEGYIVTSINKSIFEQFDSYSLIITSISIPESVTSIPYGLFMYCFFLTSININENNPSYCDIDGVLFNKDVTEIICYPIEKADTEYIIPESVTSIGDYAFMASTNLTSVTIPDSVTSIGISAFSYCTDLISITIPDSVTSIGEAAFYFCSLTSIIIPESITSIDDYVFGHCGLTSITIPDSVTSIGLRAFAGSSLTSIIIPESVTEIEILAFLGCEKLTSVTLPESITSINDSVFDKCSNLTSITIPDSVTSIGSGAFEFCSNLTSITIPDSVTSIGSGAFEFCSNLTSIIIPDSVTSIEPQTFYGCENLSSVTIPDSVTSIGSAVFGNCSSLTSITIPDSVTSIGSSAFVRCSSLTSITIPESVISIGNDVFTDYVNNVTIYGYENSYAQTYAKENNIPFNDIEDSSDDIVYGDIDCDGKVATITDVILLSKHVSKKLTLPQESRNYKNSNISLQGSSKSAVDTMDLKILIDILLGVVN